MIIESELRQQIGAALSGAASLQDLYVWLMARTWNMHRDSTPTAVELAAEVEAVFFERADGRLTDAQLRSEIAALLRQDIAVMAKTVFSDSILIEVDRISTTQMPVASTTVSLLAHADLVRV